MKLVITGGHLSPALAVIDALPKDAEVLFIGRRYTFEGDKAESLEFQEITSRKIPFVSLTTGRLQRRFTRHTLPSLVKFPYGTVQALGILRKFRPDVALLFGGYLSLPVAFAARILSIPIIIHEQTLEAGFANRLIAPFATRVCISFKTSEKFFSENKTVLTGNPLRKFPISNFQFPISHDERLPLLYVTGGSAGAHAINVLIEGCLEKLLEKFVIVHQTGDAKQFGDFDRLAKIRESLPESLQNRYMLKKFVQHDELEGILTEAGIVVSRSGINTVSELLTLQKPSLLIPLPISQKNEQLKNALFLQQAGLAEIAEQDSLTSDRLFEIVMRMQNNKSSYGATKEILATIKRDAAAEIITIAYDLAKKTNAQETPGTSQ